LEKRIIRGIIAALSARQSSIIQFIIVKNAIYVVRDSVIIVSGLVNVWGIKMR